MKRFLTPLFIIFLAPLFANAAGIQVSPSKLDLSIPSGKTTSANIVVVNPTTDVQVFEVYADDFSGAIKAKTQSFTLESGGRKTVEIDINPTALNFANSQKLSTSLSVIAKPLADNKFSVGTGVKLPLTVTLTGPNPPKNNTLQYSLYALTALGIIGILIITRYQKAPRAS